MTTYVRSSMYSYFQNVRLSRLIILARSKETVTSKQGNQNPKTAITKVTNSRYTKRTLSNLTKKRLLSSLCELSYEQT